MERIKKRVLFIKDQVNNKLKHGYRVLDFLEEICIQLNNILNTEQNNKSMYILKIIHVKLLAHFHRKYSLPSKLFSSQTPPVKCCKIQAQWCAILGN